MRARKKDHRKAPGTKAPTKLSTKVPHGAPPPRDLCLPEDLPPAFVARMREDLKTTPAKPEHFPAGDSFAAFLDSYRDPPVRSLLRNAPRETAEAALPFRLGGAVPWEPLGLYLEEAERDRPGKHPLHEAGAYYLQEASAMLPARLLAQGLGLDRMAEAEAGPAEPLRLLDLCAAPGGKSAQLAMMLGGRGVLYCNEIQPGRAEILSRNIERMGIANAIVLGETPWRLAERFPGYFHGILVDAPCSGEGMFRKNPLAVLEWSPEAVARCADRQADILDCAASMLSPGGALAYSTCTFAPAEDEAQTARFLEGHPAFRLREERKLLPHEARGEGHYCALFSLGRETVGDRGAAGPSGAWNMAQASRRTSDHHHPPRPGAGRSGSSNGAPDPALARLASEWIARLVPDPARIHFAPDRLLLFGDHLYLAPRGALSTPGLRTLRPGLHLADLRALRDGPSLLPAHALSHALRPEDAAQTRPLSDLEAAQYLGGLSLPGMDCETGEVLVTYRGFSLGWARAAGGQLKNRYPKGLRVPL